MKKRGGTAQRKTITTHKNVIAYNLIKQYLILMCERMIEIARLEQVVPLQVQLDVHLHALYLPREFHQVVS